MPIYEFRCRQCGITYQSLRSIGDTTPGTPCPDCGGVMGRKFSTPAPSPVGMETHLNPTTGTVVSSHAQFADDLKRQSEERTIRTGIEHNFVPHDPREMKAELGVTDEGLDSAYRTLHDSGELVTTSRSRTPKPLKPAPKDGVWL